MEKKTALDKKELGGEREIKTLVERNDSHSGD